MHHACVQEAASAASFKKWGLRGAGWALMWLGSSLLLSWLPALARYIPFLGELAGSLVGTAVGIATFGASLGASILLIALAWLRFRPLHGSLLGASAAALMYGQALLLRRFHAPSPLRST